MKRIDKKTNSKEAKITAPALYDCCWYEPSGNDLCCGGICCC